MAGSPMTFADVSSLVKHCIRNKMSKVETAGHLEQYYQIPRAMTDTIWENLEVAYPQEFRSYYAMLNKRNTATSPPEVDSEMARWRSVPSGLGERKQQSLPPHPRFMGTAPNLQRHAAASSPQVPQETANAGNPLIFVEQISSKVGPSKDLENQNLQASQQPVYGKAEFRQQLMIILAKIERNTDQMLKLMTDTHGCGAHHSAAGSLKRQRVEQTQESGDNEEAEKVQERERGDNEEAEKLQEKERGDNEEEEKLQDTQ